MKSNRPWIVAVDGPAGAGKSSICAHVCNELGWTYVNTGALYRAVGVLAEERDISLEDETSLLDIAADLDENLRWDESENKIYYRDINLSPKLYSEFASRSASKIAKISSVRKKLLPLQRKLASSCSKGALLEGRDIGTVVFPDADLKIFMTASLEERARRRFEQLKRHYDPKLDAEEPNLQRIQQEIAARDHQDAARGEAPLKQAEDALLLDTTGISPEQAIQKMIVLIRDQLTKKS